MKRPAVAIFLLACALLVPTLSNATQIKAYVAEFAVSPPEAGELKSTLQTLLSSRIASEAITPVATAPEADVVITGSYTQLGKVFSLDAVAKLISGRTLATVFEQGESRDDLIPALGKISARLRDEILKQYRQNADTLPPAAEKISPAGSVREEGPQIWTSPRIAGAQSSLAPGNPKEFIIAQGSSIRLYRQGTTLALVTQAELPSRQKVLAVDSLWSDNAGKMLAYITIMDGESPASRIYAVTNDTLQLVAEGLPYLFRTMALSGGPKHLYAQQMGRIEDYYGDVYEASYGEGSLKLKNPIKMPRFANIFNFNTFRDRSGQTFITAFSDSGFLVVYSEKGEELWRSNEKFGGSETYFQRRDSENERLFGTPFRTRFIDQRITVTPHGEIIVPQNSGFFVLGNARSYSKYSIVSFTWNGSSLEELWRTKQSQNYLADYFYEPGSKDLVLLEVVQKEGLFGKGGSALRVIRAD